MELGGCVSSGCVWESEPPQVFFFLSLIQPYPLSFVIYLAYSLGLNCIRKHYDRNCGRGISLQNHLFPFLSLKLLQVFNLLVTRGFGRYSTVEYFKRERKKVSWYSFFSSTFIMCLRTSVLYVSSAWNHSPPPHICMPQSPFRSSLKRHLLSDIPDHSIENHNLLWLLYCITPYLPLFSFTWYIYFTYLINFHLYKGRGLFCPLL